MANNSFTSSGKVRTNITADPDLLERARNLGESKGHDLSRVIHIGLNLYIQAYAQLALPGLDLAEVTPHFVGQGRLEEVG